MAGAPGGAATGSRSAGQSRPDHLHGIVPGRSSSSRTILADGTSTHPDQGSICRKKRWRCRSDCRGDWKAVEDDPGGFRGWTTGSSAQAGRRRGRGERGPAGRRRAWAPLAERRRSRAIVHGDIPLTLRRPTAGGPAPNDRLWGVPHGRHFSPVSCFLDFPLWLARGAFPAPGGGRHDPAVGHRPHWVACALGEGG